MFSKITATLVGALVLAIWLPANARPRNACEGSVAKCLPDQMCKDVGGKAVCVDHNPCEKVKCLSGFECQATGRKSAKCVKVGGGIKEEAAKAAVRTRPRNACEGSVAKCLPDQMCKDVGGKAVCVDHNPCEKVKCLSNQKCVATGKKSAKCVPAPKINRYP
jgi:hypothetical protein